LFDEIDRIEIKPGTVGWQQAEPLLKAVWPPEVVAKLSWKNVVGHILINDCWPSIATMKLSVTWQIGGIGGVATREESTPGRGQCGDAKGNTRDAGDLLA
jgi:hypothetical protein